MSDNVSHEFERIENTELVELLGKIRENNSEDNMIALLKASAAARFIVPVDGDEGSYSFHAVSDKNGLKYMVVYSDSDSFEVAFQDKYKKQKGVAAGFGDLLDGAGVHPAGLAAQEELPQEEPPQEQPPLFRVRIT